MGAESRDGHGTYTIVVGVLSKGKGGVLLALWTDSPNAFVHFNQLRWKAKAQNSSSCLRKEKKHHSWTCNPLRRPLNDKYLTLSLVILESEKLLESVDRVSDGWSLIVQNVEPANDGWGSAPNDKDDPPPDEGAIPTID